MLAHRQYCVVTQMGYIDGFLVTTKVVTLDLGQNLFRPRRAHAVRPYKQLSFLSTGVLG